MHHITDVIFLQKEKNASAQFCQSKHTFRYLSTKSFMLLSLKECLPGLSL